jgi:hypothetical protein
LNLGSIDSERVKAVRAVAVRLQLFAFYFDKAQHAIVWKPLGSAIHHRLNG